MLTSHLTQVLNPELKSLMESVRDRYETGDPSHDFAHILRVMGNAARLASAEGGDLKVILPAALLHDIINVPKNHPDRAKASQMAANEAHRILAKISIEAATIDKIVVVIAEHSFSAGKTPSSLESAILQDSDRLDAIGAIGIMRMVTTGCRLASVYYHGEEPFPETRSPNDRTFTIDHLYVKLFRLVEMLNTKTAKREGALRGEFMKRFVDELRREILQLD